MRRSIVHRLVGYDRATERMVFDAPITNADVVAWAMREAGVPESDPDAAGSYPLSEAAARDIAGLLDKALPPHSDFFLEPQAA